MQPLWKMVWILRKLNIKLPHGPAGLFWEEKKKKTNLKITCDPMFIAALFTVAKK